MTQKTTVIGFLGSTLDKGFHETRWQRWRPTLSLLMHDELYIDEMILLYDRQHTNILKQLQKDAHILSPNTTIIGKQISIKDPWDFSEVYGALYDFIKSSQFDNTTNYYLHITTGTHVAQICWYLLIDAHYLPAKIIQTSPAQSRQPQGEYRIIDLDLSKYDNLKTRFINEQTDNWNKLKDNITTQNLNYNTLIRQIEKIATRSNSPILLTGATGVGKSHLAKQIYQLKKEKFNLTGQFIDVNCATLKGDSAMSALFGHTKGAFTGATATRDGYLKAADGGLLFLDEIGELGLDEQAMLLKAIEEKCFFAVGADKQSKSDFLLMAGTNKDLKQEVKNGKFREDLWARLNTWVFALPSLKDRKEDILPNIYFELRKFTNLYNQNIQFYKDALDIYLNFAKSNEATWSGNFRDLTASIHRMATLSNNGYIDSEIVHWEIDTLKNLWQLDTHEPENFLSDTQFLAQVIDDEILQNLDEFDKFQLIGVLKVCIKSNSMADAGRKLFNHSRLDKKVSNDSDRLKKYLARFKIDWSDIRNLS